MAIITGILFKEIMKTAVAMGLKDTARVAFAASVEAITPELAQGLGFAAEPKKVPLPGKPGEFLMAYDLRGTHPDMFKTSLEDTKSKMDKFASSVLTKTIERYQEMSHLLVTPDGKAGLAVDKTGSVIFDEHELTSVFASKDNQYGKTAFAALVDYAVTDLGATRLQCYQTVLPDAYQKLGVPWSPVALQESSTIQYSDEFKAEIEQYKKYDPEGKPGRAFMVPDPHSILFPKYEKFAALGSDVKATLPVVSSPLQAVGVQWAAGRRVAETERTIKEELKKAVGTENFGPVTHKLPEGPFQAIPVAVGPGVIYACNPAQKNPQSKAEVFCVPNSRLPHNQVKLGEIIEVVATPAHLAKANSNTL